MDDTKNESHLVYECMKELGKHGAVYRCNSGSVQLSNGRRFSAMPKGFADIMVILPGGRAAFIECKTGKNDTSEEQKRFLQRMRELGALAGVARSVTDARTICRISGISEEGYHNGDTPQPHT